MRLLTKKNDSISQESEKNSILKFELWGILVIVGMFLISYAIVFSSDKMQLTYISKWRQIEKEAKYLFNLDKVFEQSPSFAEMPPSDLSELFNRVKPKEKFEKVDKKDYKYRFLNGAKVEKNSEYYMSEICKVSSGLFVGYSKLNTTCQNDIPCARIYVDVNGRILPNRFGKDIFGFNLYRNKIEVLGHGVNYNFIKKDCSPKGSGIYCSSYFSGGGDLN